MTYKIGILDQNPKSTNENETDRETLLRSVDLAKKGESWGYHRYWTAEHHNSIELVGPAPEILVAYLINETTSIRLGSGGIMLQHYSPYKVAEVFQVLEVLAPGRIDLGIGSGRGGLPLSTRALQYGTLNDGKDFGSRVHLLQDLLNDRLSEEHELHSIQVIPRTETQQPIYLLGASSNSAVLAKESGLSYTFAHFYSSEEDLEKAAREYNTNNEKKHFILAVAVFAADTEEEAKSLTIGQQIFKLHLANGNVVTVVSEESGHQFGRESGESYELNEIKMNLIAGTTQQIKEQLDILRDKYDIDEFVFHTPVTDAEARLHSFELLSPNRLFD